LVCAGIKFQIYSLFRLFEHVGIFRFFLLTNWNACFIARFFKFVLEILKLLKSS